MKKFIVSTILLLTILSFIGCSLNSDEILKLGKYALVDNEDWAWIVLEEDNQFEFNRASNTSYRPNGTYSIESNILTLRANEYEIYTFKIKDEDLIFESGKYAENLLESPSVFKLVSD